MVEHFEALYELMTSAVDDEEELPDDPVEQYFDFMDSGLFEDYCQEHSLTAEQQQEAMEELRKRVGL